jgi:hypothetical protein
MSTNSKRQVSYGFTQPLVTEAQAPIVAQRAPTTNDKAQYGTIWLNQPGEQAYILTSITNNEANWEPVGAAGGEITIVTDAGDAESVDGVFGITGGDNINTAEVGGNGVQINLNQTVNISGSFITTGGNVDIEDGNLEMIQTTGATVGVITMGAESFAHSFGTNNTFLGLTAGNFTMTGQSNTGIGVEALHAVTTGTGNATLAGMNSLTNGSNNASCGDGSMAASTGSSNCSVLGAIALNNVVGGQYIVAIGYEAGSNYTTTEESNVVVSNNGTVGESNVIRIGTQGNGLGQQNECFIAGITGSTVTGSAVLCSTGGQLGTISSSIKFKENIQDLNDTSILNLRPVKFNYKKDTKTHYGLIAEEVQEVFPDLVLHDEKGDPLSVAYHEMPALLLSEIKKLKKEIDQLREMI